MRSTARLWMVVLLSLSLALAFSAAVFAQDEDMAALEIKTADEAFAAADKGNPIQPGQGKITIAALASGPEVPSVPTISGAHTLRN